MVAAGELLRMLVDVVQNCLPITSGKVRALWAHIALRMRMIAT
jgi:hypothetical protein